jgi:hypothetical protein
MPQHNYPPAEPGQSCQQPEPRGTCGKPAKYTVPPVDWDGKPMVRDSDGRLVNPSYSAGRFNKGKPAEPVPMCGVHAAMHYQRAAKAERREAHRIAEAERRASVQKRYDVASNLALFLTQQLGIELTAVRPHGSPEGTFVVAFDVEEAQRMYSGGAKLMRASGFGPSIEWGVQL